MTTAEKRLARAKLIADARKIYEAAKAENRALTAEDEQVVDRLLTEVRTMKTEIDAEEAAEQRAHNLESAEREVAQRQDQGVQRNRNTDGTAQPYVIRLRGENLTFQPNTAEWRRHQPQVREAFRTWLRTNVETRDLQTDIPTSGGYLTVPEEFVADFLRDVDNVVWMRTKARKFTTNAQSLGVRKRTARLSSFAWGAELDDTEVHKDTSLKFGKRVLTPHYMTGMIIVSRDLLRAAIIGAEEIARSELVRDSSETEETAFMTGDGNNKPLGIFTASADGISTGRDVSSGNTTTAIGADNLRTVKYTLKPQYRNAAEWLFHRDAIALISKLKDGEGQYLWQPGVTAGDPDRLLGLPVNESEFAPNTFTTGLYVGMLGVYSNYWVVDGLTLELQTLLEKYATTNQIGYIARRKVDGMPVVEEAFVRIKLA